MNEPIEKYETADDMIRRWIKDDRRTKHTSDLFDAMTDAFIEHYEGRMSELDLHVELESLSKRMAAWNRHCQKLLDPPD